MMVATGASSKIAAVAIILRSSALQLIEATHYGTM